MKTFFLFSSLIYGRVSWKNYSGSKALQRIFTSFNLGGASSVGCWVKMVPCSSFGSSPVPEMVFCLYLKGLTSVDSFLLCCILFMGLCCTFLQHGLYLGLPKSIRNVSILCIFFIIMADSNLSSLASTFLLLGLYIN